VLLPKSVIEFINRILKAGYGRHSETERVLVNNDSLASLSLLKIQSGHPGNLVEQPFDGDEMNMHQPQNILAETELRHLAAIPYQIISPSSNSPIIGMYQDSLLGAYEFTRGEIEFDPRTAMNLLMSYPKVDTSVFKDRKNITNFEILSQIMPPISLKYKTSGYNENEDEALTKTGILEIKNGKYIRGQADKNVFGSGSKGILHRVYNDYGHTAAYEFIDNIQQVITDYMKTHAFSVGVSDLICDKKTNESILQVIAAKKNEVQEITNKIHMGVFENNTGKSNMAEYENQVGNILNDAINVAGKLATKSLGKTNRFVTMVSSGSKGSPLNMSQMLSCLGQTSVDGKRVPYGFDNRTLPHYSKYDDSPSARGFIESSYISGLSAPELFFHAMGGRIGLIDTAIKTSSTGYIQRRLIKGLEDLKVEYDMTVRNNMGRITQFAYGDDSIDTTKVENQSMRLVTMSIEDVYMHYDIPGLYESSKDDRQNIMKVFTKGASTRIQKQKEETRKMCKKYVDFMLTMRDNIVKHVFKGKNDTDVRVPVAFQYLIQNIQGQLDLNSQSAVDITPLECMELVEEKFQDLSKLYYTSPSKLFEVLYYFYLSPKDLLLNKRFNKKAILLLLDNIEIHYRKAIVHPGEMVGVIAGQSIGEPTTQMTLNSFTYETEILVKDHNGKIAIKQIGEFVNHYIEMATKREYYSEKDTTYAELNEYWEVPSVDENGNVMWKKIEAVTKHPVINEDGTNTMLKVTTREQREVVATKAKSFLKLVDGQIQPLRGDELSVGDYLPVNKKPYSEMKTEIKTIMSDNINNVPIVNDLYIPNCVNGKIVMELKGTRMPDIFFDEVISIEEVPNTTEYAYDLTVADTKNFNLYNGLCVRDTFHSAGVASKSNVTRGVPRIEEILRLTKNPKNPSMTIALKQEDQQNKDKAVNFCNMIQHTTLIDLVKSVQICYDPDDNNTRIHDDKALIDQFYEFEKMVAECNHPSANEASAAEQANRSKWIIRIEMNADALLDKNISMDDIHFAITQTYGNEVYCVFSDFNSSNLVFRVRMNTSAFRKSKRGNALDQSDDIFILKNFQDSLLNNIVIRGITGVSNVMPRPIKNSVVKEDGKFVRKDTWVLDTVGTNMIDLMTVDFIDYFNTFTNDIREIYDVLGIEAARQSILNEFNEVMEFSGGYVNYHHLSVLCDRMTVSKKLVPIFRSGIMNDDTGPIAKATFEMHTEAFLDASRHGEFDQMRGVSANVMCGQPGYYGTNAFQVVLDMKAFENMDDAKTNVDDVDKLIEDGFKNLRIDETDECSKGKIMIDNNIRNLATKEMGVCLDDGYNLL